MSIMSRTEMYLMFQASLMVKNNFLTQNNFKLYLFILNFIVFTSKNVHKAVSFGIFTNYKE